MLERAKSKYRFGVFTILVLVVSMTLFASPAEAATCVSGVLKDGETILGTCTVTSGTPTDVTCTGGSLTSGGTTVGTCSLSQQTSGDLQRDGIFGCNANKYANVGSLSAVGGVYVPVNDAAVTLNTGYLVYKECVLDGVIAKVTEAARTDLVGTVTRDINTGRNGKARYFRSPSDFREIQDREVAILVSDEVLAPMCEPFRKPTQKSFVRSYLANQNAPNSVFACTYPVSAGRIEDALAGRSPEDTVLEAIGALAYNNPALADLQYREWADGVRAASQYWREERLRYGNGFYDVTDENGNPFEETILTPAYLVSQGATQAYTAGFRCLEGADELSEVCAPLFAAMIPESLTSGLYNMTRAQSGLPSYVNRMISEAAAAVRAEAVNVALSILLTTRQFEFAFKQAKDSVATTLTNAINRLRATERTCWELIAYNDQGADKHVCASPPQGNKCATTDGVQITIATSTQFSQAVISAQIAPFATRVAAEITVSENTLQELDRLIANVTNASSETNQRAALSRLDQMVAPNARLPDCSPQKTLHSAGDVQCANKEKDDANSLIGLLVENTLKDWGDSMDANVGWCNINNPAVIERWTNEWK